MTTTADHEVGKARARKEDARLITGQTNWTDNITLPGMVLRRVPAQPARARPDHVRGRVGGPRRRPA